MCQAFLNSYYYVVTNQSVGQLYEFSTVILLKKIVTLLTYYTVTVILAHSYTV